MAIRLINNKLNAIVTQQLIQLGNDIVAKARSNASWSKEIPRAISLGEVKNENGKFSLIIKVDSSPDGPAPQAAAYEYGSGIHNKNNPQTYVIKPKNAPLLAFEWHPEYIPWHSRKFAYKRGDTFLFRYVDHPGVAARPYLKPAMESSRKGISNALKNAFLRAYRESTVRVEVIK